MSAQPWINPHPSRLDLNKHRTGVRSRITNAWCTLNTPGSSTELSVTMSPCSGRLNFCCINNYLTVCFILRAIVPVLLWVLTDLLHMRVLYFDTASECFYHHVIHIQRCLITIKSENKKQKTDPFTNEVPSIDSSMSLNPVEIWPIVNRRRTKVIVFFPVQVSYSSQFPTVSNNYYSVRGASLLE